MRRTERLFAIAEVLRARRSGITAEELAERFEVSARTIHRDLDSLRASSMPIFGERGRGGGLVLDKSYSLPPVNFSAQEAAILVAAGRWLERARLMPFVNTLRSAIDKVQGALPPTRQRQVARLTESLSWVGVPARSASPKVRAALEEAWAGDRPVHILYEGARGPTKRQVQITSVIMERTTILLNCEDLDIREARQFHMHKILEAELI